MRKMTELKNWKFTLDQTQYGESAGWATPEYDDSRWVDKESYTCWETYEHALRDYEANGVFRTWAEASGEAGKRYVLRFDGVGGTAKVFVNGVYAGGTYNRYLPFEVDVTEHIHAGQNLLAVWVDNSFQGENHIPGGKKVEWVLYGGLTHRVYFEERDPVRIAHVRTDAAADGSLKVSVALENLSAETFSGVVSARAAGLEMELPVTLKAGEAASVFLGGKAENVRLWSPEEPNLYDLETTLSCGGKTVDSNTTRIGFRTICVEGTKFLLNGKEIYLKGANRYDEYAPYGICPPEELIRQDLLEMKKCGMNLVRTHYPQDDVHYRIADEIGIMYMIEVPVNWLYPASTDTLEQYDPLTQEAVDSLDRTFLNFCNHPCWTVWSMGNECGHSTPACQKLLRMLAQKARAWASGRLITFASCRDLLDEKELDFCDFLSINYYSGVLSEHVSQFPVQMTPVLEHKLGIARKLYPNIPHVMTEFGYPCVYGMHGNGIEGRFTEEFGATFLRAACDEYRKDPNMKGLVIWSWADYRHRRGFVGGGMHLSATYGSWGLVTSDRLPKKTMVEAMTEVFTAWHPEE